MIHEVIDAASAFMTRELGLEGSVVSVDRAGDGWIALVEAILVDPVMRRVARKDLVVTFELRMNEQCDVQSFSRKYMRERGSIVP